MKALPLGSLRSEGAALLRWWIGELRDFGQQLLERTVPKLTKRMVIEFKENTAEAYFLRLGSSLERITISRESTGDWPDQFPTTEPSVEHHGARATLVLAPDDTFSFYLFVPHALRRDIDKVITLQLERELPLARDQFGVDYQICEQAPGTGKIRVQVLVAHRSRLDQLRTLAQQWALHPTRIGAPGESGAIVGDFLRSPMRFRSIRLTRLERRVSAVVFALVVALGTLISGQWTYERIVVGADLRRVGSEAQIAARLAARLTRESAPARELVNIMRVPDASDVLAALTRTVPAPAWVYRLHIEAPSTGAVSIRMGALAPSATTLVNVLEGSHRFGTVELVSATSVGGPSDLDRIKLTAARAPGSSRIAGSHTTDDTSTPQ